MDNLILFIDTLIKWGLGVAKYAIYTAILALIVTLVLAGIKYYLIQTKQYNKTIKSLKYFILG